MRFWIVGLLSVFALAGCQGSVIGDAIAGKEKLAQQDDEYCKSIGARQGTDIYVQCRMVATQSRDSRHARSIGAAQRNMAMQTAMRPRTTNCNAFGNSVTCTTY